MKIGIFDPYLDTLGGGERYIFSIAWCLSKENKVSIFWDEKDILEKAEKKFGLSLGKVSVTKNIFQQKSSILARIESTKQYDILFVISDGSIPFLFAKKNFLIFQFPLNWVKGRSIKNRIKLHMISGCLVYSKFVKEFIDNTFNISSIVLPPGVPLIGENTGVKENIILSVGRFTGKMNAKKQETLIEAFKKLYDKGLRSWRLILIGSYLSHDKEFVDKLQNMVGKYPIEIITNITYDKLKQYYQKSKIYWHATGYGENLQKNPERAEHFGITTVEAMGAGVVPVVINAGGQKEIVTEGKDGFLWDSLEELEEKTGKVISDNQLWKKLSLAAKETAKKFSPEEFCRQIQTLLR